MRLTVLGTCGGWPDAGQACSGYLIEHDGFHLVVDLGYATVPRLFSRITADRVDAVFVSHGHPDHCADLNPLLRARALRDSLPAPLPVYAPRGALDAVLALAALAGRGPGSSGAAPGVSPRARGPAHPRAATTSRDGRRLPPDASSPPVHDHFGGLEDRVQQDPLKAHTKRLPRSTPA